MIRISSCFANTRLNAVCRNTHVTSCVQSRGMDPALEYIAINIDNQQNAGVVCWSSLFQIQKSFVPVGLPRCHMCTRLRDNVSLHHRHALREPERHAEATGRASRLNASQLLAAEACLFTRRSVPKCECLSCVDACSCRRQLLITNECTHYKFE